MPDPVMRRMALKQRIRRHVHAEQDRNRAALKAVREKITGLNGPVRAHPTPDDWPPDEMESETPEKADFLTACWVMFLALVGPAAFDRDPY
ncbi:MAG: hypothetical protein AAF292_06755 [Pseudomonadota bacterium]